MCTSKWSGFRRRRRDRNNRIIKAENLSELSYYDNRDRWDLINALSMIEFPEKVSSIMNMSEELFQEYKFALLKAGKIRILKH